MDQFLAEYYGTGNAAQATDDNDGSKVAEAAQFELFAKVAAAEGIDLNQLSDEQVEKLYSDTFSKEAGENPFAKKEDGEGDDDDKKEKAKDEHEEKKASAEKVAEADFLGRVMAHSYVQELNKIAASKEMVHKPGGGSSSSRGHDKSQLFDRKQDATKPGKSSVIAQRLRSAAGDASKAVGAAGKAVSKHVGAHKGKYIGGAAAAGGLAAGALAAHQSKKASAIDELAAEMAYEKAAAAGWDAEEAASRISAIMTLGPSEEGSKVAAAENVDQAIDIRSSEILELAGYPVSWE